MGPFLKLSDQQSCQISHYGVARFINFSIFELIYMIQSWKIAYSGFSRQGIYLWYFWNSQTNSIARFSTTGLPDLHYLQIKHVYIYYIVIYFHIRITQSFGIDWEVMCGLNFWIYEILPPLLSLPTDLYGCNYWKWTMK